jgi:hypothetical protein
MQGKCRTKEVVGRAALFNLVGSVMTVPYRVRAVGLGHRRPAKGGTEGEEIRGLHGRRTESCWISIDFNMSWLDLFLR